MDSRDHPPPIRATKVRKSGKRERFVDKEKRKTYLEYKPHFNIVAGECFCDRIPYTPPDWPTFSSLEVFSVIVNKLASPLNTYGEIVIAGTFGFIKLFERVRPSDSGGMHLKSSEEDITFVNENGQKELLLTGSTKKSMLALDRVEIYMQFTNEITDMPCEHQFTFDPDFYKSSIYDTLLSATFKHAAFGSVTLNYAVFDFPLVAKVEVVLLKKGYDGEENTYPNVDDIVGQIYAKNSFYKNKSMLFYRRKKKTTPDDMVGDICINPDDGNFIPLSKAIVSLPSDATLDIGVNLTDSNSGLSIVNAVAVFQGPLELRVPATPMTCQERISVTQNIDNKIRVTVTWSGVMFK